MTRHIHTDAFLAALALTNAIRREFLGPGHDIPDLPFSSAGSTTDCAIARGIRDVSRTGTIRVGGSSKKDAAGNPTTTFIIVNPVGYPDGTTIERFLPPMCQQFIREFDAIQKQNLPSEHLTDPYMGRLPNVNSKKAQACGCVLCLNKKDATIEEMVEAIALHGKPGSKNAGSAMVLPSDIADAVAMEHAKTEDVPKPVANEMLEVDLAHNVCE